MTNLIQLLSYSSARDIKEKKRGGEQEDDIPGLTGASESRSTVILYPREPKGGEKERKRLPSYVYVISPIKPAEKKREREEERGKGKKVQQDVTADVRWSHGPCNPSTRGKKRGRRRCRRPTLRLAGRFVVVHKVIGASCSEEKKKREKKEEERGRNRRFPKGRRRFRTPNPATPPW